MKRTQSLVLLAVLAVVMVLVYVRAFRPPTPSVPPVVVDTPHVVTTSLSSSPSEVLEAPAISSEAIAQRAEQRRRAAVLAWGRDPFVAGSSVGEASGLELSGILWDPSQPMAIINGQTLHPGDECEGYRIVTITPDTVTLTDGAESFSLTTAR